MPWYTFGISTKPKPPATTAPADTPAALTAAAAPVKRPESSFLQHTQTWQSEAWGYYDSLGEFNSGVWWLANMLSRVRVRAARVDPSLDEPEIVNDGVAAEIVNSLAGGVGGQSNIMRTLTIQMAVPGDCYLIGEGDPGQEVWTVRSTDEVRVQSGKFQTVSDRTPNIEWTDLPANAVPVRIWRPHARYFHVADSTARAALPIMRELELVNRHITAQYLSRLASAGVLVLPDEVTFPVREEFAEANDPFVAEWIEIAAEAIRTPGTASAVIPIPIRVPAEYVDKVKHLDFTLTIDDHIIDKRQSAISRLANKLDIPAEVLTGLGQVNHWTAWQLDEGALKTHIAPTAEAICDSLTKGYLWPRLKASGEDPSKWVVWYDMSELAVRPDRSSNAQQAYDRFEISGEALRRESGFDEADKPEGDDLRKQYLEVLLKNDPQLAATAFKELTGTELAVPAPEVPVSGANGGPPVGKGQEAPPGPEKEEPQPGPANEGKPPEGPGAKTASAAPDPAPGMDALTGSASGKQWRLSKQAGTVHAIRFSAAKGSTLIHPALCTDAAYSCPLWHAAVEDPPAQLASGTYEAKLDFTGRFTVGGPAPNLVRDDWITTPLLSPKKVGGRRER